MTSLMVAAAMAVLTAWAAVRLLRAHAVRLRLIDHPNQRSSHRAPTPRGGGAGIVLGSAAGLAVASLLGHPPSGHALVVFACAAGIAGVGLVDDVAGLGPMPKLAAQAAAAVLVLSALGPVPLALFPDLASQVPAWIVSIGWICAVTNFFNFMDGIDGLAGGQTVASLAGVLVAAWAFDASLLSACVGAATVGFLAHNWSPARIFMGDVGSGFLGFLLAGLPLLSAPGDRPRAVFAVAIGLTLFLLDPIETLFWRARARKSLMSAHREHSYQQLVAPGEPAGRVAFVLVGTGLALSILGAAAFRRPALMWMAIVAAILTYAVERTTARRASASWTGSGR